MTKTNLFLVTLVAAVPAAYLLFVLGSGFLSDSGPSGMLQIVSGLAILCALAVALMPVGALVFGPAAEPKPPKEEDGDAPAAADEEYEEAEAGEMDDDFGDEFGDEFGDATGDDEWDGVEFGEEDEDD